MWRIAFALMFACAPAPRAQQWASTTDAVPAGHIVLTCFASEGCAVSVPPPDAGVLHVPPCDGRQGWAPHGSDTRPCWEKR